MTQGLTDDEIALNSWLAEDLGAKVGDELTLRYWIVGPQRRLEEKSATLRVKRIVPLSGEAADPTLMPDIPGLSDKKNCRDWEPGVPVDLNKIRDKDQAYWDHYRGAPKAFVRLAAGQKLWNNRFGNLTAVRYPVPNVPSNRGGQKNSVLACIRQALSPASQGVFFAPLRERALAASGASTDFGGLFIGFSLFLLVSALLLAALLFSFSVERRRSELNTLRALGYSQGLIRRLVLTEGGALALIGSLIGAGLATLYTRAVISALSGIWSGAVAGTALQFHAEATTLLIGGLSSFITAMVALWLATRPERKRPSPLSLTSLARPSSQKTPSGGRGKISAYQQSKGFAVAERSLQHPEVSYPSSSEVAERGWEEGRKREARFKGDGLLWPALLTLMALGSSAFGFTLSGQDAAGAAFGAGALLLIAGLLIARYWLRGRVLHGVLAQRNAARRPGRSLAAISLLACGTFLVVAVGANQHDPRHEALEKSSGTGGFAFYAEASLPVFEDLNTPGGREKYNLDESELKDTKIVALKLREGDEASCLNLNKAQTPRLLGVEPGALAGRFSVDWSALEKTGEDGAIPVIGDSNTVLWSLGKKPGDTLDYTDDHGVVHKLKIVAAAPNATFQGSLLMGEANFVKLFPERSGYRVFFIDTPEKNAEAVRRELTRALEDSGLSVVPSGERLAAFQQVENTYLSVFAALGGLGLLLGSAGLGVIVLRNVEERRSELALLRAVGYEATHIQHLLLSEHILLLLAGLGIGTVSGILAILPSLRHAPPMGLLLLTLVAVLLSGLLWVILAARAALRGPLLSALRSE
ncbi:MAG: ABC transporter permease [Armatimonas sp.]